MPLAASLVLPVSWAFPTVSLWGLVCSGALAVSATFGCSGALVASAFACSWTLGSSTFGCSWVFPVLGSVMPLAASLVLPVSWALPIVSLWGLVCSGALAVSATFGCSGALVASAFGCSWTLGSSTFGCSWPWGLQPCPPPGRRPGWDISDRGCARRRICNRRRSPPARRRRCGAGAAGPGGKTPAGGRSCRSAGPGPGPAAPWSGIRRCWWAAALPCQCAVPACCPAASPRQRRRSCSAGRWW